MGQTVLTINMKRRVIYGAVALALCVNFLVGARLYLRAAEKDSVYPSMELFAYVMERVRKDYVDGRNLTYQDLVYGALKGMLSTLDPHSEFMDPQKYRELQNDTQGAFGGLGISLSVKDTFLTVVVSRTNTPAWRAGIMSGDRIVKIEGKSTEKMTTDDAVKNLRGEPGTEVRLTVFRPSANQFKDYKLTRAVINVDMVTDLHERQEFKLGENKIGYVHLIQFGEKTDDDLEAALRKLTKQGMRGLVLDLRNNPGGLLDQAVDVCSKFLPRGQLVVTTEGRNSAQDSRREANGHDELDGMPIVVLINDGSASASEIVAGCLQDLKRAVILGERSFGKGSVQSILPLQDGSALRLTTAKYYTPSHKVIHEEGIMPDIVVGLSPEENRAVQTQLIPGGLESLDEKERQAVLAIGDPQLQRAMDLLKGITLYTLRSGRPEQRVAQRGT